MVTHTGLIRQRVVYGTRGRDVTPSGSNVALSETERQVVAASDGNLVIRPLNNGAGDAANITFTGITAGFIPPYIVRAVIASGTTCNVYAIED